jgi:hypothetical protein
MPSNPPRIRTYLEFVEPQNREPAGEDLEFAVRLLETRREPADDPLIRSLESLLMELLKERPKAPPPAGYDRLDQKIILSTFERSLSPARISRATGIPISEVYRRIRKLDGLGLLKHVRTVMVTKPSKKLVKLYRTNLKKVHLMMDEGELKLGVHFRRVAARPGKVSIRLDPMPSRAGPP